jgi:hypothetical protein
MPPPDKARMVCFVVAATLLYLATLLTIVLIDYLGRIE